MLIAEEAETRRQRRVLAVGEILPQHGAATATHQMWL
jgi:hypothetical protein